MKDRSSRKKIRLENRDYSMNGAYFITICTKDRFPYLSEIRTSMMFDDNNVGDGVLDVPNVELTEFGKITEDVLIEINEHYQFIDIMNYVIMPDHLHLIISVNHERSGGTSRTPSPTNATIPALVSTFKRFVNKRIGFNIWQRSYYDHIIRGEGEFAEIWRYIENNPLNHANNIFNQNLWR
ncbi:MAG: transposase [Ruminococcus sp.]|nr:transposase [Ruminococcus sp.]